MKVRITETPNEHELDGVVIDKYEPGEVDDVSSSIGSWLMAEGYAELEMRREPRDDDHDGGSPEREHTRR